MAKEKQMELPEEREDGTEKDSASSKKEEAHGKKKESPAEEIERLKSELRKWQNEYYKSYADIQNLRREIERDHKEALKYRAEGFVGELLPVLDGFYMALREDEAKTPEMKSYLTGFGYLYKNLVKVLRNEGVEEIEPAVGAEFDPARMEALETKVSEGPENVVLEVLTKGYKLHDHLIRPAMVVVSRKEGSGKETSEAHGKKDGETEGEDRASHEDA